MPPIEALSGLTRSGCAWATASAWTSGPPSPLRTRSPGRAARHPDCTRTLRSRSGSDRVGARLLVIHITRDLLTVLLDQAAERDPDATSLRLSATRAGEFDEDTGLDPSMPVVTHFTPAGVGGSVNAVFGSISGRPPDEAGHGSSRTRTDSSACRRGTTSRRSCSSPSRRTTTTRSLRSTAPATGSSWRSSTQRRRRSHSRSDRICDVERRVGAPTGRSPNMGLKGQSEYHAAMAARPPRRRRIVGAGRDRVRHRRARRTDREGGRVVPGDGRGGPPRSRRPRDSPTTAKGGRSRSARRSIRCHRAGSKTRRSSSTHCTQCSTASGGRAVGS